MATTDIRTCRGNVDPGKIRVVIKTMSDRHFWALPEKQHLFVNDGGEELAVHRTAVNSGSEKAARVFGSGSYTGKPESIPEDFPTVEQHLKTAYETDWFATLPLCRNIGVSVRMAGILRRSIATSDWRVPSDRGLI